MTSRIDLSVNESGTQKVVREIEDLASACELLSPELALSLRGTALRVGVSTDAVVRNVAVAILEKVVRTTPVDTGQARGNWQVYVSSDIPDVPFLKGHTDADGASTIAAGKATISSKRAPGQSIFISNSAPYIEALDRGWSQQAPTGMTAMAMQAGRNVASNAKILGD